MAVEGRAAWARGSSHLKEAGEQAGMASRPSEKERILSAPCQRVGRTTPIEH